MMLAIYLATHTLLTSFPLSPVVDEDLNEEDVLVDVVPLGLSMAL